jgi:beta-glucosidase
VDVTVDERALHEVYLPHFRRVADAGVASVMSAYNSVNGEWCGENATLLRTILRGEWGWDGFVTSDFTFGLRDGVKSVRAGLNIEMPFAQQRALVLADAVASGELDETVVDELVVETVATLLRFAPVLADRPDPAVLVCDSHRALAREAAAAAMVLVRNEGPLLPVDAASLSRVAVLGRLARVPNLGDHGSSNVLPPSVVTPLDGLRAALAGIEVVHDDVDAAIAEAADLVVVVVGFTKHDEGEYLDQSGIAALTHLFPPMDHAVLGFASDAERDAATTAMAERRARAAELAAPSRADERDADPGFGVAGGDRASLRLRAEDEALIAAACERSDRVVVCIMGGSAVVVPWLERPAATLVLWYPGMEGGHALADVLLGRAEPGGRLPFAVPVDEGDLVAFDRDATEATYGLLHGQWKLDADGVAAHLPFGWGLGYTTWALGETLAVTDGGEPQARVRCTNTGTRAGSTVVQVYASVPDSAHERPPARLVGFRRVHAAAGATVEVEVRLDLRQLDLRLDGEWVTEEAPVLLRASLHAGGPGPTARLG